MTTVESTLLLVIHGSEDLDNLIYRTDRCISYTILVRTNPQLLKINTNMEYIDLEELSSDEEGQQSHNRGENGLSTQEATLLLEQYGPNALPEKKKSKVKMNIK